MQEMLSLMGPEALELTIVTKGESGQKNIAKKVAFASGGQSDTGHDGDESSIAS